MTQPAALPERGRYVQVPIDLPAVSDAALVLWMLDVRDAGPGDTCEPSQAQLQRDLGRTGVDPGHIGRLQAELERAGMLAITRSYQYRTGRKAPHTHNVYRPLLRVRPGDRRAYVEIPLSLLDRLAEQPDVPENRVTVAHVAAAYRWQVECRLHESWTPTGGGWTDRGVAERATAWGHQPSTARTHRSLLLRIGYLDERQRPGKTPLTALAGELPAEVQTPIEQAEEAPVPHRFMSDDPTDSCRMTPPIDPTDSCRADLPTYGPKPTTEELPKIKNIHPVPVGTERTVRTARGRLTAAPPRVKKIHPLSVRPVSEPDADPIDASAWLRHGLSPIKGSKPSVEAMRTLARLPRSWHACPSWVRRELARRIDAAFRVVRPDAIVFAIDRYAATGPAALDLTGDPQVDAQRHIRALTTVIHQLVADARAGACIACGHDHTDRLDAIADCACCTRLRPAPTAGQVANSLCDDLSWADGTDCASCGSAEATLRADLPIPVPVCDPCWVEVALVAA